MADFVLSDAQQKAVTADASAIVVVAGAGSGKTEVLARRVERLLGGSEHEGSRILAVSYTVKAADELRERLADRLGDGHRRVDADTIHGFAHDLIRQHGSRVGLPSEPELLTRDEDRAELLDSWLDRGGIRRPNDLVGVLRELDLARARCEPADYMDEWAAALESAGAIDFASMLEVASELAEGSWLARHLRRLYSDVLVDEAQNLSKAQYRFLSRVIGSPESDHINAMLVGDERQSIVGFAGADSGLIRRFEEDYAAERIELHTNFRSAAAIVAAGKAIAEALGQPEESAENLDFSAPGLILKQATSSEDSEGELVAAWIAGLLSEGLPSEALAPGESRSVAAEQIAVLARSAASLRWSRESLSSRGIPAASASTPQEWVKSGPAAMVLEMVAFHSAPEHRSTRRRIAELCGIDGEPWDSLEQVLREAPDPAVAALADLAACGSPEELMSAVADLEFNALGSNGDEGQIQASWFEDQRQLSDAWSSFVDRTRVAERTFGNLRMHVARLQRGDALDPGVRLLTVHKAQGREFKAVALVACNDGQFPDFRAKDEEAWTAELRTFYVAVTRTSRVLLLTRPTSRSTRRGPWDADPSPFLKLV